MAKLPGTGMRVAEERCDRRFDPNLCDGGRRVAPVIKAGRDDESMDDSDIDRTRPLDELILR